MRGADLFVAALENEGVETVFGLPGEEVLDLLDALRRSRIKFVATRHEQVAAFMAATHGRLTGRAGVCLATRGAGALNLATGAAFALLGAFPVVIVTGQAAAGELRQTRDPGVDVVAVMTPLTKASGRIAGPRSIPGRVREAFRLAEGERPGPVHLELPEDVAAAPFDGVSLLARYAVARPVAPPEAVAHAAELLAQAEAPLLMIGAAANRPHLAEALADFVERVKVPFFATPMGKGAVACGSVFYLGTAALAERDYLHRAIDRADLIVAIGLDAAERSPFVIGRRAGVLHIGAAPASVEDTHAPRAELVGDVARSLGHLADAAGRLPRAGTLLALRDELLRRVADRAQESRFPLTPQRIVHDVRAALPADGIVCLDGGMMRVWFARNFRTMRPGTLLLDNALGATGAGLASAMAAALQHPGRRVVAVCGDGGFLLNAQDLVTAVQLRLDLVAVVVVDDAYGMIRWKQAVEGLPAYGVDVANPDFAGLADAMGATGTTIAAADELASVLVAAFAAGGVHLVAVPVDYGENMTVLVDELSREVNGAGH